MTPAYGSRLPARIVMAALSIVLLASCGSKEPARAPAGKGPEAQARSGALSVRIIPEAPTVRSQLSAVYSGMEGASAAFRWEINGEEVEGFSGATLPAGGFWRGDEVNVTASVDGRSAGASVIIANTPPAARSIRLSSPKVFAGMDIRAEAVGEDADGDTVRFEYQWIVNGEEALMHEPDLLTGGQFKSGDTLKVRVTPYDGYDRGRPLESAAIKVPNAPPYFTSTPPLSFSSRTYTYAAAATDPDGDEIRYSLEKGPSGMKVDASTGRLEWEIGRGQAGLVEIGVGAQDAHGAKTVQNYSIRVEIRTGP